MNSSGLAFLKQNGVFYVHGPRAQHRTETAREIAAFKAGLEQLAGTRVEVGDVYSGPTATRADLTLIGVTTPGSPDFATRVKSLSEKQSRGEDLPTPETAREDERLSLTCPSIRPRDDRHLFTAAAYPIGKLTEFGLTL